MISKAESDFFRNLNQKPRVGFIKTIIHLVCALAFSFAIVCARLYYLDAQYRHHQPIERASEERGIGTGFWITWVCSFLTLRAVSQRKKTPSGAT